MFALFHPCVASYTDSWKVNDVACDLMLGDTYKMESVKMSRAAIEEYAFIV